MVHIITFDLDLISSAGIDINIWKKEVEMFEVTSDNFDSNHTHNKFYLDVEKFSIENQNYNWVNLNKKFICYEGSKEAIEFMHTIDNNDSYNYDEEVDLQVQNNNFSKLTLQELKDLGYIFDQPKYQEEYMIMEMDIENKLKKAQFGKYDKKTICFSHPFFKSIVDNNKKDSTKWIFYFVKIMVAGNKVIAFFIDFGDGTKKYYDFSQIPPPPGRPIRIPNLDSNGRNTNPGNEWHAINGGNAISILTGIQRNRVFLKMYLLINPISFYVFVTFFLSLFFLNLKNRLHKKLIYLLSSSLLTEIAVVIFIIYDLDFTIVYSISFILHFFFWLIIFFEINKNHNFKKIVTIFFLFFGVLNLFFLEKLNLNYLTFIFGSFTYIIIFFYKIFDNLNKEKFNLISFNSYIILITPILFFIGFSLLFSFRDYSLMSVKIYKSIIFYDFISYSVNIIYYSLINIYIYRERKLQNA